MGVGLINLLKIIMRFFYNKCAQLLQYEVEHANILMFFMPRVSRR